MCLRQLTYVTRNLSYVTERFMNLACVVDLHCYFVNMRRLRRTHMLNSVEPLDTQTKSRKYENLRALEDHPRAIELELGIQFCSWWAFKLGVKVDHVEGLQHMFGFRFGYGSPPWQLKIYRSQWQSNWLPLSLVLQRPASFFMARCNIW